MFVVRANVSDDVWREFAVVFSSNIFQTHAGARISAMFSA